MMAWAPSDEVFVQIPGIVEIRWVCSGVWSDVEYVKIKLNNFTKVG